MLIDPVDAFFAGCFLAGRAVLGLGGICIATWIWMITSELPFRHVNLSDLLLAFPMSLFVLTQVAAYWVNAGWFLGVGCVSFACMLWFLWAFIRGAKPPVSFFGCFAASAVYSTPAGIDPYGPSVYNTLLGIILCGLISSSYWSIPRLISTIAERRQTFASLTSGCPAPDQSELRGVWFWAFFVALVALLTLFCLNWFFTYAVDDDRYYETTAEDLLWSSYAVATLFLLTASPFFFRRVSLLPIIGWTVAMIMLVLLVIRFCSSSGEMPFINHWLDLRHGCAGVVGDAFLFNQPS